MCRNLEGAKSAKETSFYEKAMRFFDDIDGVLSQINKIQMGKLHRQMGPNLEIIQGVCAAS